MLFHSSGYDFCLWHRLKLLLKIANAVGTLWAGAIFWLCHHKSFKLKS